MERRKASQFALVVRRDRTDVELPHGIHQKVNQMPLRQPIPRRRWQQPHLIRSPSSISLLAHNQPPCQPTRSRNQTDLLRTFRNILLARLPRQAPRSCFKPFVLSTARKRAVEFSMFLTTRCASTSSDMLIKQRRYGSGVSSASSVLIVSDMFNQVEIGIRTTRSRKIEPG